MKETKLIKFNIFLLILSLCIIFFVPLMTGLFSKTAKPASAEEPGIPLETYLNGNFNYAEEEPFAKTTKIRQKKCHTLH